MMGPAPEGDLVRHRHHKLAELRRRGIDPFGARYPVTHWAGPLAARLGQASADELKAFGAVSVAGRVVAIRHHGKTCFAHFADYTGRLQLYARADQLGEEYELFTGLDVGDFIGVTGEVFRTRTGELTVAVKAFTFLAKALRPLPEKWHGLRDVETRYRRRYVDLIVNAPVREVFVLRSRLVKAIREFLDARGFLEVETPMMQPIPGGAVARPFRTHHNALDLDLYLRIAPELYLKRLIVGGLDRVYEINRSFRNEGIDTQHNPEFTMLEFYQAFADYTDLMDLTEELFVHLAQRVRGSVQLEWGPDRIDLTPPWPRLPFFTAISHALEIPVTPDTDWRRLAAAAAKRNIVATEGDTTKLWKEVFETLVEPTLVRPTFVIDFPVELSPLAKTKREQPRLVDRFELFIGRRELANAYSELNDPIEQRARFLQQAAERERGDEEAHWLDEDYIRALEFGMPPTAGEGIGIDRLVMLFANVPSIREVILFPHLRPETDTDTGPAPIEGLVGESAAGPVDQAREGEGASMDSGPGAAGDRAAAPDDIAGAAGQNP
jgi:lysyl-tRNA synthetase, class II